jgi:hypothetical protein
MTRAGAAAGAGHLRSVPPGPSTFAAAGCTLAEIGSALGVSRETIRLDLLGVGPGEQSARESAAAALERLSAPGRARVLRWLTQYIGPGMPAGVIREDGDG